MSIRIATLGLIAFVGTGCLPTPASSTSPTSSPVSTPATRSPTAAPTPSPEPTVRVSDVVHIVTAIDDLAAAGPGSLIDWFNSEGKWVTETMDFAAVVREPVLQEYVDEVTKGLEKIIADDPDFTSEVEAIVALRSQITLLAPGISIPEPEPTPSDYGVGDTVHLTNDDGDWADVTITQVKAVRRYDGPYNLDDVPKKGHTYLQVRVTYSALVDGVDYGPGDWQVFVNDEAAGDTTYVSNGPEAELEYGTLPKGRKVTGYMIFEVPTRGRTVLSYGGGYGDAPVFEVVIRSK